MGCVMVDKGQPPFACNSEKRVSEIDERQRCPVGKLKVFSDTIDSVWEKADVSGDGYIPG